MKQLYSEDVILTYESPGMPPIVQLLVGQVYLPPGNLLLYHSSLWREHVLLSVMAELNKQGKEIYKNDRFIREQFYCMRNKEKILRAICNDFINKQNIEWDDLKVLIQAAQEFLIPYQYFDTWFTDGAYPFKADPSIATALKFAETAKNVLRENLGTVFFSPGKVFLGAFDHLADRLSISRENITWYFSEDLEKAFQGKPLTEKDIVDRKEAYVYFCDTDKKVSMTFGKSALDYIEKFDRNSKAQNIVSVKGISAHSTGKVIRGNVRIIKSDYNDFSRTVKAMNDMEKGDILFSPTTAPDLMPAFHKAAAVVTDAGGMLSHAGITARELNLPCIVGTRNATKIFKDGDLVEVDTNTGIVKKLI